MPDLGIGEAIVAGLTSLGVGAETAGAIAPVLTSALAGGGIGAGVGGVEAGLTGGNIGQGLLHGAEGGALTGGGIGVGGALAGGLGATAGSAGAAAGDILGGAGGGALGGLATGGSPLTGALEGSAAGGLSFLNSSGSTSNTPTGGTTGPTTSQGLGGVQAPSGGGAVGGPSAGASAIPSGVLPDNGLDSFLQGQDSLYPTSVGGGVNAPSVGIAPDLASPGGVASPNASGGSLTAADQNFLTNASNSAATTNVGAPNLGGGAASPAPSTVSNFTNDPSAGNFGKMLAANAGPLVAGGGLLANVVQGNKPVAGENQVNAAAAADTAAGNQNQAYLQNGTLPPGAQASINQAAQSQKAAIKSRFAQMGSSGSSSEQQELAAVDQWAQGQGSQLALELLKSGISQSQMGAALYSDISKNALAQDQSLASSIGAFASSLAGGTSHPGQIILNTQAA